MKAPQGGFLLFAQVFLKKVVEKVKVICYSVFTRQQKNISNAAHFVGCALALTNSSCDTIIRLEFVKVNV